MLQSLAGLGGSWHAALGATAVSGEDRMRKQLGVVCILTIEAVVSVLLPARTPQCVSGDGPGEHASLCFKGHLHSRPVEVLNVVRGRRLRG